MERKKILVNLVSERLEKVREHLEKQWGTRVSNSHLLDHVVFYYLISNGLESLPIVKIDNKNLQKLSILGTAARRSGEHR